MKVKKRKKKTKKKEKGPKGHSSPSRHYPGRNIHHLTPNSRRNKKGIREYGLASNTMLIKIERHEAINRLVPKDTLEEIIVKLISIYEESEGGDNKVYIGDDKIADWRTLFGDKSLGEVIYLLSRLHRAKKRRFD